MRWAIFDRQKAKRLLLRSVTATCVAYAVDDWLWGLRLARGRIETSSGMTHAGLSLADSLAVIEGTYRRYCRLVGVDVFRGTVAEVGPGDNLGVALLLAKAADEVWTIDRYAARRDPAQHAAIYAGLAKRHGLSGSHAPAEATFERIRELVGEGAESFFRSTPRRFDAILSNATLEHVAEPVAVLNAMVTALAPGGRLVHVIDLSDHGMFAGRSPLTFLTVGDAIYRRMTRNSGRPNRFLYGDYTRWLASSRLLEGQLLVSALVNGWIAPSPAPLDTLPDTELAAACTQVARLRGRIARRLRAHSDHELAVAGCILVARRRG